MLKNVKKIFFLKYKNNFYKTNRIINIFAVEELKGKT